MTQEQFKEAARTATTLNLDPATVAFERDWRRRAVRLAAAIVTQKDEEAAQARAAAKAKK